MKIRKYRAATVREALTMVKDDLGPDAIILKTQELTGVRKAGENVEVTAAMDDQTLAAMPATAAASKDAKPAVAEAAPTYDRRGRVSTSAASEEPLIPRRESKDTIDSRMFEGLRGEVAALRQEIRSARRAVIDGVPEGLGSASELLATTGLDASACRDLLAELALVCPIEERTPDRLRSHLQNLLARRIPVSPILPTFANRTSVILFLGPTGVGKSTTIAKMVGAHLLTGRGSVGVITTDCYRMGAVEQMQSFAGAAEVPLETVFDPADVDAALERLRGCSLVLVDTAGRSRTNTAHLEELAALVKAFHPDQVHLVLSANTRDSDLRVSLDTYKGCSPTHILVTKLDETSERGCLAWLPAESKLPISQVCFGQRIPDDLLPADSGLLARMVLGEGG